MERDDDARRRELPRPPVLPVRPATLLVAGVRDVPVRGETVGGLLVELVPLVGVLAGLQPARGHVRGLVEVLPVESGRFSATGSGTGFPDARAPSGSGDVVRRRQGVGAGVIGREPGLTGCGVAVRGLRPGKSGLHIAVTAASGRFRRPGSAAGAGNVVGGIDHLLLKPQGWVVLLKERERERRGN